MTLTLIGGWGNYDHREISFFNQVNTGTLGGKGGPFDQAAYTQLLTLTGVIVTAVSKKMKLCEIFIYHGGLLPSRGAGAISDICHFLILQYFKA